MWILKHYKHMLNTRSVDKKIDVLETRKSKHQKLDDPEFPYLRMGKLQGEDIIANRDNGKVGEPDPW